MRVLLVHNRYRSIGGEERHLDLLEVWLRAAGVLTRRFEVASPSEPVSLSQQVKLGATLTYRPAGARVLRDVLAQDAADVVHFHNVFPLLTPAAFRASKRCGAAVVLTVHNYRFACPAGTLLRNGRIHEDCVDGSSFLCGLRNARGVWGESLAYGLAIELQRRLRLPHRWVDAYVAPSRFVGAMLARAGYPEARIHTISHGVPTTPAPSPSGDYALYVGRLSEEKGIRTLIAASRLAPSVPLVIAGDGPLAPLVRFEGGENVSYLGRVDEERVGQLFRDARFAVMPSEWYECQPYAALEAMSVGTPLVASRLGGLMEVVEDGVTGILVPHKSPAALASAMQTMWAERGRTAEMGVRAWRAARERFEPAKHVTHLISLYERLRSEQRACSAPRCGVDR